MATTIPLPEADKRAPYDRTVTFIGPDWSGQAMRMEIRNRPGDQGSPLVGLDVSSVGQGLSATLDPAFPIPRTDLTAPATDVRIRINETTLEGLAYGTPYDQPVRLVYDLHVGSGAAKRVVASGPFVISPGVTL